jgi:hypothetical protein
VGIGWDEVNLSGWQIGDIGCFPATKAMGFLGFLFS